MPPKPKPIINCPHSEDGHCTKGRPHFAKGYCRPCYQSRMRAKAAGKTEIRKKNRTIDRCPFAVNKTGPRLCVRKRDHWAKGLCRNCRWKELQKEKAARSSQE